MTCSRLSTGTRVSSTNKTDRDDIAEILLEVTFNIIPPDDLLMSVQLSTIFIPLCSRYTACTIK